MSGKDDLTDRRYRLIRGRQEERLQRHGVQVAPAADGIPPFPVNARVEEEDTYLVLSAEPKVRESAEPLLRLWNAVHQAAPEPPGSVSVREGPPLRLLAVVHDLNEEPSWREEWVAAAYAEVFREVAVRGLRTLALPLLATRHGRMPPERSLALLDQALACRPPGPLARLWLILPAGSGRELLDSLETPQR